MVDGRPSPAAMPRPPAAGDPERTLELLRSSLSRGRRSRPHNAAATCAMPSVVDQNRCRGRTRDRRVIAPAHWSSATREPDRRRAPAPRAISSLRALAASSLRLEGARPRRRARRRRPEGQIARPLPCWPRSTITTLARRIPRWGAVIESAEPLRPTVAVCESPG